jgi:hypothetical protein
MLTSIVDDYWQLEQVAITYGRFAEDTQSSRWHRVTSNIIYVASDRFLVGSYPILKAIMRS